MRFFRGKLFRRLLLVGFVAMMIEGAVLTVISCVKQTEAYKTGYRDGLAEGYDKGARMTRARIGIHKGDAGK